MVGKHLFLSGYLFRNRILIAVGKVCGVVYKGVNRCSEDLFSFEGRRCVVQIISFRTIHEILGSEMSNCLLCQFSCVRIKMIEFVYSRAVASEHQDFAVVLEILDHHRLRLQNCVPLSGFRVNGIDSVSVIGNGRAAERAVVQPCAFHKLQGIRGAPAVKCFSFAF